MNIRVSYSIDNEPWIKVAEIVELAERDGALPQPMLFEPNPFEDHWRPIAKALEGMFTDPLRIAGE